MKTCSHKDAPNSPWREVTLDGFKVRWPLKLVALPSGAIMPEPVFTPPPVFIEPNIR